MNKYIGHPSQLSGVEEVTLARGRGKGMTLLLINNGLGLSVTLNADRAMDIARISFKGDNMGYFSPCGYVAPQFYDGEGTGFLKSFTAGFMTTCGLASVGNPCTDNGERLPLHGTISNTPAESFSYYETEDKIVVRATVRDAAIFARQLLLEREYTVSKVENRLSVSDRVVNIGSAPSPCQVLYHVNLGYPLLSEALKVSLPSISVTPRNSHAEEGLSSCLQMEKPQKGYEEMCYYHTLKEGRASAFNPSIKKGLTMSFDLEELPCFVEWKQMGEHDYVLGLEPGNALPDGRDVMRRNSMLCELDSGGEKRFHLSFLFEEATDT